ncbi:MAG: acyltransferase family protein [Roseovarius sp.]
MSDLAYRKELDGLRAIAVLSVILFHVGFPDMKGGYVGVDIFFVLSGYLICGQTYMRLEAGSYSVTEFFARRIRRLSTAYALCFIVTALVANAFFLRSEMQVVADGFLGSITFTNNFNLLNSVGYFSGPAHENPFLHTWSLSIEEQFYIVLPMLILLTRRSRAAFTWMLGILFVVSLALTLFSGDLIYDREQRFFSSAFRIWELAAGGLIFLATYHRLIPARLIGAPLLGLALVLAPVNLLDSSYLYPGWATLLPVMGTVILIAFARPGQSWIARGLAWGPMAYIGRISYGAYLWHWPIIVGAVYYGVEMTDPLRSVMTLGALALGALSYHFVETPIRRISVTRHKARLYLMFAAQSAVMLALAAYLFAQPGKAVTGEDARLESLKAEIMNTHPKWDACWSHSAPEDFCKLGVGGDTPDFFVWGDSMVNSAWLAFDAYGRATGQAGLLATEPACAPLKGVGPRESCLEINRAIFAWLAEAPPMDVFLMARWSFYSEGYGHDGDRPGQVPLLRADGTQAPENFPAFLEGLEGTMEALSARHRVIIVNHFPEYPSSVPKAMLRTLRFGTPAQEKTLEAFEARNGRTVAALSDAAERFGAIEIRPYEDLCASGTCDFARDGVPLYMDNVHLGPAGNAILEGLVMEAMEGRR